MINRAHPCSQAEYTTRGFAPVVFNNQIELERYTIMLKEYYEIVDEARPLSGFLPTHADFFTEMHL